MGELRQQEVNLPSFRRLLSQVKRSISIPHMKMFESEDYVGLLPGMSRSSSERSSSSTGSNVCSKNLVTPLSKPDGGRSFPPQNLLWDERQQISSWSPDHDLDPPMWDVDLSRQLATKLMMAGEDEGGNLLGQSDTHNPYALMSSMAAVSQDTSIHLNASTTDASGVSNPRFKTEICRNFKEKENQKNSGMIPTAGEALRRGATMPTAFFKTAAQVVGFANMRKSSLMETGDSSSSDDGRPSSVHGYNLQHYVRMKEQESSLYGLDKFPTFVPRGSNNVLCGGKTAGPVGSGRPRVVWPGA